MLDFVCTFQDINSTHQIQFMCSLFSFLIFHLQFTQHFFNASLQSSTTCFTPLQIFLGGKVHISCIDCNFHFFGWLWLCKGSNFDWIFRISPKMQHYLPHRRLEYKLYKPFPALRGLIQAHNGMREVNQWLCGCVVSNLRCLIFRMKQIEF